MKDDVFQREAFPISHITVTLLVRFFRNPNPQVSMTLTLSPGIGVEIALAFPWWIPHLLEASTPADSCGD